MLPFIPSLPLHAGYLGTGPPLLAGHCRFTARIMPLILDSAYWEVPGGGFGSNLTTGSYLRDQGNSATITRGQPASTGPPLRQIWRLTTSRGAAGAWSAAGGLGQPPSPHVSLVRLEARRASISLRRHAPRQLTPVGSDCVHRAAVHSIGMAWPDLLAWQKVDCRVQRKELTPRAA